MFLKAYTILDAKTGDHCQPMFFATDGAAIRAFMDAARDSQSALSLHPEDYIIYSIGGFDSSTGMLHAGEFFNFGSLAALIGRDQKTITHTEN